MNTKLFACTDCKQYINAGRRWCYVHLERTGIVVAGQPVVTDSILAAECYWRLDFPEDPDQDWLLKLLPQLHSFLNSHKNHRVLFGEPGNDHFLPDEPWTWDDPLLWDDGETGEPFSVSVRTLVNTLGCRSWADVADYMQSRSSPVSWWGDTRQ